MQVEVPEGKYLVTVANDGYGGSREIEIPRNQTVSLNLDELKGEGPKMCRITFKVGVEGAVLYIDGKKADYSKPIDVRYGIHTIAVEAEGYDTITKKLVVNSAETEIEIALSKNSADSSEDKDKSGKNSGTNADSGKNNAGNNNNTNNNNQNNNGNNNNQNNGNNNNQNNNGNNNNNNNNNNNPSQTDYLTTLYNLLTSINNNSNSTNNHSTDTTAGTNAGSSSYDDLRDE